jgi:SAM-dependent methyltransferase
MTDQYYADGRYWADRYGDDSTFKVDLLEALLLSANVSLQSVKDVAEIGCGPGTFLLPFARRYPHIRATGWDIASEALATANAQAEQEHLNVGFELGTVSDIWGAYDLVFCLDVLEHVRDPWGFLDQLAEIGSPVVLNLPIEQSVAHLLRRSVLRSNEKYRHLHFYSLASANLMLRESRFHIRARLYAAASPVTYRQRTSYHIRVIRYIRAIAYRLNAELASTLLGGTVMYLLMPTSPERRAQSSTGDTDLRPDAHN